MMRVMKIQFLGTAAFEGIPAMFCHCELCAKAKLNRGKDIRTRTSVMIDTDLKVDFPPDTYMHMLREQLDLDKLHNIIFTHSHSDHLYAEDLLTRVPGYSKYYDHRIALFGNDKVLSILNKYLSTVEQDSFTLTKFLPFETYQVGEARVTPLLATHDPQEDCFILYIEKSNKVLLYGHDSGDFPDATWEWLQGKGFDIVILECTMGYDSYRKTHMNIIAVKETKQRMEFEGMLQPDCHVIVTHFSHNGRALHSDLEREFAEDHIIVAYDGMVIEV